MQRSIYDDIQDDFTIQSNHDVEDRVDRQLLRDDRAERLKTNCWNDQYKVCAD